jgi:hypothetical protein
MGRALRERRIKARTKRRHGRFGAAVKLTVETRGKCRPTTDGARAATGGLQYARLGSAVRQRLS